MRRMLTYTLAILLLACVQISPPFDHICDIMHFLISSFQQLLTICMNLRESLYNQVILHATEV